MSHHVPGIGGPGTLLPAAIESLLSWSFGIACLFLSGYHYVIGTLLVPYRRQMQRLLSSESSASNSASSSSSNSNSNSTSRGLQLPCWVPLTTFSRGELDRATPFERYQQFMQVLHRIGKCEGINSSNESPKFSDNELTALIRTNEPLRRLASLAMRPSDTDSMNTTNCVVSQLPLGQQLIRIWSRLLELPNPGRIQDKDNNYQFAVSLIIPCYQEQGSHVRTKLQHALNGSVHPEQIQVILVDAGRCSDLAAAIIVHVDNDNDVDADANTTRNNNANVNAKKWGQVKIVEYLSQGGRGPCLNFGADHASGRIYAFLHSDTRLPAEWDLKLAGIFDSDSSSSSSSSDDDNNKSVAKTNTHATATVRANSCAFGFGVDTTREGLNGGSCPPGIRAVEVGVNLRCQLWSLPYGDQCLCVPAAIFNYLGGYPNQCFMEDYEFIALLRKRVALLPAFGVEGESLKIVPGAPALCSPRRWQKFGVLYVTFMNSKLIHLYASGRTPEEIYKQYYGQSLASGAHLGQWETRLHADGMVQEE
jgi:glycosyltransferase involved in cell wall biosynthesis